MGRSSCIDGSHTLSCLRGEFDVRPNTADARVLLLVEDKSQSLPLFRCKEEMKLHVFEPLAIPFLHSLDQSVSSTFTGSSASHESPRPSDYDLEIEQPSQLRGFVRKFVEKSVTEMSETVYLLRILGSCAWALDGVGVRQTLLKIITRGGPMVTVVWGAAKFVLGLATIFGGHTMVGGLMAAYGAGAVSLGVLWSVLMPISRWSTSNQPVANQELPYAPPQVV